jgi:hypothetical protein
MVHFGIDFLDPIHTLAVPIASPLRDTSLLVIVPTPLSVNLCQLTNLQTTRNTVTFMYGERMNQRGEVFNGLG